MNPIDLAIEVAWQFYGVWYLWAGDDPSGIDCSGLAVEVLKSVGLLKPGEDLSAAGLWDRFISYRIRGASRGALVFYEDKNGTVVHVEICLDEVYSIGAHGGELVKSVQEAVRKNAFVYVRPIYREGMTVKGFLHPIERALPHA